ncbi:M48 family metallopeptidase [Thalassococcus sp. CAU 1522]|uniref:M48 family metallopeptidase n=1 Tax=Thalassococcus arenae TaxID=2851652 RepID=A0ABS6N7L2_9RHOB|nr:M48 family metallopeptidase [Thalassococcus arenae]MBV2359657.1 M48 family metallopeptidase [Thalassococcus arenae]
MRAFLLMAVAAVLAACEPVVVTTGPAPQRPTQVAAPAVPSPQVRSQAQQAARGFVEVVERVEPIAERECRARTRGMNCDFLIVVDDRPGQPPNAFQTVDRSGRPILAFNLALIATVRNTDEMAFVMGHEAAHHILSHLDRQRQNATVGAVIFSGIAAMTGADAQGVRSAEDLGAAVGARTYSKDFEIEADELGTVIAHRAGFDPVRGAAFFTRLPDPGNRFLGSHPPNAARIEAVRRVASKL